MVAESWLSGEQISKEIHHALLQLNNKD